MPTAVEELLVHLKHFNTALEGHTIVMLCDACLFDKLLNMYLIMLVRHLGDTGGIVANAES
jgi:hypothetical protein